MQAQKNSEQSIDGYIDSIFEKAADLAEGIVFYAYKIPVNLLAMPDGEPIKLPLILLWLVVASIVFTLGLRFFCWKMIPHGIACVSGRFDKKTKEKGEISSFESLMACLSGTVGLGNIAGVAIAVSLGGPGAVFWMVLMGFMGMAPKFAETMMGMKYRVERKRKNGTTRIAGGPMYYLRDGFKKYGYPKLGMMLAALFAIFCIGGAFGAGNMFQANQAYRAFVEITGGPSSVLLDKGWLFGLALAILTAIVIIGGIESIANVTSKLVPLMAGIYLAMGVFIIIANITDVPMAFGKIFAQAFTLEAGWGGFIGGLLVGVQRSAFSNEAGVGSAGIIQAAARSEYPVQQGCVGMLGPIIDTVIICTITALVIVITGEYMANDNLEGVKLASRAFEHGSRIFPFILSICVLLFAYSTLISWSYIGQKALTFLFGESRIVEISYKLAYLLVIMVGTSSELVNVIRFADALFFAMSVPNIIGLYFLLGEMRDDTKNYKEKILPNLLKRAT